ncbi:MAG: glycosyltransferase family 4 protein [Bacteroidetes bacterium]|nr:glycosyltransferase family 4 protein [Bacteroidota bacterium]
MKIGFDAKRAFLNHSGLGNYSRMLIRSLLDFYPENNYSLFTTRKRKTDFSEFISSQKNTSVIHPENFIDKQISSRWRSYKITPLLLENKIDVYHGLSNELPFNISKFKGKKIVTIHDLIFLRYPKLYPFFDRKIYDKKFKSACDLSDKIVAVSQQTKNDIVKFYSVDPEKIKVIYQSCDEVFCRQITVDKIKNVKSKYKLPQTYLLYVGTIEKRKNLLTILKALTIVKDISLVVVGKKKSYFKKVQDFISSNDLGKRINFLEDVSNEDLPAIYNSAEIFIYPSLFEGFGIPIIEALTCKTPVITTQDGCFAEAGGPDSIYIDPMNHEQLAEEIKKILSSPELRKNIAEKGYEHSKLFLPQVIAAEVIALYSKK